MALVINSTACEILNLFLRCPEADHLKPDNKPIENRSHIPSMVVRCCLDRELLTQAQAQFYHNMAISIIIINTPSSANFPYSSPLNYCEALGLFTVISHYPCSTKSHTQITPKMNDEYWNEEWNAELYNQFGDAMALTSSFNTPDEIQVGSNPTVSSFDIDWILRDDNELGR